MTNIELLDSIMLSNNVYSDFYAIYSDNIEFKKWLDDLLPEIDLCEKQQQNNPWHKYNVLGHILYSVQAMNNLTRGMNYDTQRMLAYTMLLHDIGKPNTHIVRQKNGELIDSFFNHNIESCKVAKRVLGKLNFNSDQVEIISKLVYKHDIFMFIRLKDSGNRYHRVLSYKLISEEIEDLNQVGDGYTLLKYLVMVGRSDNLAQNEKMTAESLKLLDTFDTMLDNVKN